MKLLDRYDWTVALILSEVAERHRGDDAPQTYLCKLARTMTDMLAGRPVRTWRLERAQAFFVDVAETCLRQGRPHSGCF